jgi:hypothetical protein
VASVNPESAHTGCDAGRRLERRAAVSHTGDIAVGRPDLRHGRRAPLERPVQGLRGLLPPSSVPGALRSHDIPFGRCFLIGQQMNGPIKSGPSGEPAALASRWAQLCFQDPNAQRKKHLRELLFRPPRRGIAAWTTIAALHARNDQFLGLDCIYVSRR